MKALERIFLYSVLAILVFYVFLVDNNVESQEVIQQEIRARSIDIVNDEGRSVVMLWANENGGMINIANKKGDLIFLVSIGADRNGNGIMSVANKDGTPVADMRVTDESGGMMVVANKDGKTVGYMGANKDGNGGIIVSNKDGKVIGNLP
jgi:hypothetical protein